MKSAHASVVQHHRVPVVQEQVRVAQISHLPFARRQRLEQQRPEPGNVSVELQQFAPERTRDSANLVPMCASTIVLASVCLAGGGSW